MPGHAPGKRRSDAVGAPGPTLNVEGGAFVYAGTMRYQLIDLATTPNGRPGDASSLARPGYTGKRKLSDYEREIAHALMRKGMPKERAIPMARGLLKKAAKTGRWGDHGKAHGPTRAGAKASIAQRKAF